MPASSDEGLILDPSVRALFGDDLEGYAELSAIFIRSSARRLVELDDAWSCGEQERIVEIAHALASSAESIGARRLGRACRALERDPASGGAWLERIRAELGDVKRRLPAAS